MLDTPQTIPIDTLLPIYQATLTPELAYQNGDTTLPDIFASYTLELYDVPEVDGFPIAIFSERDDDGPGSGSFTDLVSLDDFTRSASLLARTDSLTQDSTFKVRVYGYMVKGLMAGKMAAQTTNAADDLFNLPPGYSVNNDINDPNCGLPIDAIEDNIFVHCLEFRIGEPDSVQELNILLGESKYLYAISDPNDNTKLQIKEYDSEDSIPSSLPNGGISDAFNSDNFVEIVSGDKAGVYWERKGAIISDEGDITTTDLPNGMIRVIGRYWEDGKTYNVKFKAISGNRTGLVEITVVRPDKLGDKYGKAKDVFDNPINVDSLIIANAGKFGIPPQIMKAHISVEAAKKDFGGNIGWGFAPSFRYEPYTVQLWDLKYCCSNYFFKDSIDADFSDVPNHQYVLDRNYYKETKTVWDIIKEESQLVNSSKGTSFGKRDANGKMNFGKYTSMQRLYDNFYNKIDVKDKDFTISQRADSTNKLMIDFLQNKWTDQAKDVKGAKNMIAQTRAASSYGLLQMLYVTAIEKVKYEKTKAPEKMNEQEFFIFAIQYQRQLLQKRINKNNEPKFNWNEGFESLIRNSIFRTWNPNQEYPNDILRRTSDFTPIQN